MVDFKSKYCPFLKHNGRFPAISCLFYLKQCPDWGTHDCCRWESLAFVSPYLKSSTRDHHRCLFPQLGDMFVAFSVVNARYLWRFTQARAMSRQSASLKVLCFTYSDFKCDTHTELQHGGERFAGGWRDYSQSQLFSSDVRASTLWSRDRTIN